MEHHMNAWFMPTLAAASVDPAIVLPSLGSGAHAGALTSEAANGALSADATPFAPAGPAFSIWSVIYAGLLGYAIYQLLPAQRQRSSRHAARHASLRPWAAASALLNAAWIGVVQAGVVWA